MATVKIVLRKNYKKKEGTFPIALRITQNRKSRFIFTGEYIKESDWNSKEGLAKKSHPNSKRLNNYLLKKLSEAHSVALDVQTNQNSTSSNIIKKKIVGKDKMDFFEVSKIHLSAIRKRKKIGQLRTEEGRLGIFKDFLGTSHLHFSDLDVILLKKFQNHLLYERNVSTRTAINYLILIRTIYNLAIKEFDIDSKSYPFGKDKVQIKLPESEKIGLNKDEVKLLEEAQNLTPPQQVAVHIWLLSFYFAGIRIGDVIKLRKSDFRDGRLHYRMDKNEKLVSLSIPEKAKAILDIYTITKEKNDLIFPFLQESDIKNPKKLATRKNTITRSINRRLERVANKLGIDKKLSMHIARHTFGNLSGDKIPIQMLQKLYRHSSITTTVNYQQNFMHKETDEALDSVINF
ncbi:tyrosine recombinase [Aquaticitalea lipolytica]|uniref:Tyrosine recombinase n=1 Tax=Aquaticitalea lipolytica TaxID=1247562 RepID=A0A8J2TPU0_9FLAO|nr:site-specific integrase [Aquaticitalea lipolytica]GFZ79610.1 tyrosine recombinase [Aquaticitalea lipolytica]